MPGMESQPKRVVVRSSDLTPAGALRSGQVHAIVSVLRRGGFAMIPSDTCYSLAVRPTQANLSEHIGDILSRVEGPLSIAFDTNIPRIREWVDLDKYAIRMIDVLTPGSLTLVSDAVPGLLPGGITPEMLGAADRTIGIRIPDGMIERELVTAADTPLTTAAVRTLDAARNTVTDFEQAREIVESGLESLGAQFPLALVEARDSFRVTHSTVVRVGRTSRGPYEIMRQGAIPQAEIDAAIDRISPREPKGFERA